MAWKWYIFLDLLFLVFCVLYLIGDADHQDNFLKYTKAIPVWLMVVELFAIRSIHKHIKTIIAGLLFGSAGDMFLLWGSTSDIAFGLGALSFLVGHIFYVTAFVFLAEEVSQRRVTLEEVLKLYPVFIIIWLILLIFSFWSISTLITYLASGDSIRYVLDVYGTVLTLLTMGGFFFFFICFRIPRHSFWAGLLFMVGSLIFFASDNFLAHGKFNSWFKEHVSPSTNTYFIMITYYVAQFMIAKGAFFVGLQLKEQEDPSGMVEMKGESHNRIDDLEH